MHSVLNMPANTEAPERKGQDLSPEGLSKDHVFMIDALHRAGDLTFNANPDLGPLFTIGPMRMLYPTDAIANCFPASDREEILHYIYFRFYLSDQDALARAEKDEKKWNRSQARPLPKKVFVLLDTQSGNVKKLKEKGYQVETAFTINQAVDCVVRMDQETQAKIRELTGVSEEGLTPEGFTKRQVDELLFLRKYMNYKDEYDGNGQRPYDFRSLYDVNDAVPFLLGVFGAISESDSRFEPVSRKDKSYSLFSDLNGIQQQLDLREKQANADESILSIKKIGILFDEGEGEEIKTLYEHAGIEIIIGYQMDKVHDLYLRAGQITTEQHEAAIDYLEDHSPKPKALSVYESDSGIM